MTWTPEELAYLGGLLDGEGYFSQRDSGCLAVRMASPVIISWLASRFGGRTRECPPKDPKHKLLHEWHLEHQQALAVLLPQVRPFLRHKSLECELLERLVRHATDDKPRGNNATNKPELQAAWSVWHEEREQLQADVCDSRKDVTTVLALDPGERVGWARAAAFPDRLVVLDHGIARLRDMATAVHRAVVEEDRYDLIIYETWRLRANVAKKFAGNEFPSSQFIGAVRLCGWVNPRVKVIGQGPPIKATADKIIPKQYPDIARRIANAPASHDESHDTDALRHLAYWHWQRS